MATVAAGGGRDGRADDVGELGGGRHRPGGHDGPYDAAGETALAVVNQQRHQVPLAAVVDDVGRGQRLTGVHAHVEGCVGPIAEPPLGSIQLRRADAEVEQGARDPIDAHAVKGRIQTIEAGVHHLGPGTEGCQCRRRRPDRDRILVEADDGEIGQPVEDRRRVAASPQGGVEHDARGNRGEQLDHLRGHHREMGEPLILGFTVPAHPQPFDQLAAGMSPRTHKMEVGGEGDFHPAGRRAAHGPGRNPAHGGDGLPSNE